MSCEVRGHECSIAERKTENSPVQSGLVGRERFTGFNAKLKRLLGIGVDHL